MDLSKLVNKKSAPDPGDLLALFRSLDRKATHTDLRPAQAQVVGELTARRGDRDLVLKMPTGAGKSALALLWLKSHMLEAHRPGVYLCPTRQLVSQVLKEAAAVGIAAHPYRAGERQPHVECIQGEAVTVCTYDKLFNARTTFDRPEVNVEPAAIVLDDAHAGVEEVRAAFTLRCTEEATLKLLLGILAGACSSRSPGLFAEIQQGREEATIEVPYWLLHPLVDDLRTVLTSYAESDELKFVWKHLRDDIRWCRCVVAARGVELVPDILPVEGVRAYQASAHRLFMSATLADDSVLVRELACSAAAASTPIAPKGDVALGERMVIAPTLIDATLDRAWLISMLGQWHKNGLTKKFRIVVLCAREVQVKEWGAVGARAVIGDDVAEVVQQLQDGTVGFAAFAQRYDGVDLPDDACRLLVIDGMPYGQGIVDQHDSIAAAGPGGPRNRLIYRIEQGMGRAVRSPVDYAAVILVGPELASFTARSDVRALMNSDSRTQLEAAHELARFARTEGAAPRDAFIALIKKSFMRDADWKDYYQERVRNVVQNDTVTIDARAISLADAERRAALAARDGNTEQAATIIGAAVTEHLSGANEEKGPYLQEQANYLHPTQPGRALEIQAFAYAKDRGVLRPPGGVVLRPVDPGKVQQATRLLKWYAEFTDANGPMASFQEVRALASFDAVSHRFEGAIRGLAKFVGAEGCMPERDWGEGPDDLLLFDLLSLVIEAKNEARYAEIPKKDVEQLLHSLEWFKVSYPTRAATPVIASVTNKVASGVYAPEGTRVLMPAGLDALLAAIEGLLQALAKRGAGQWTDREVTQLLTDHGLAANQMIARYTRAAE